MKCNRLNEAWTVWTTILKLMTIQVEIKDNSTQNIFYQNWLNLEVGQYITKPFNCSIYWEQGGKDSTPERVDQGTYLLAGWLNRLKFLVNYHCYQLPTKRYPKSFLKANSTHTDEITAGLLCWYCHKNWSHIVPSSDTGGKWEWDLKEKKKKKHMIQF